VRTMRRSHGTKTRQQTSLPPGVACAL
jgi:hypothetical protein